MYFLFALTWSVGISVDEDGRKEVDHISHISPVYLPYISVDEDGRKEVDGPPPHTLSHSLRVPLTLVRTPTPYP